MCLFFFQASINFLYLAIGAGLAAFLRKSCICFLSRILVLHRHVKCEFSVLRLVFIYMVIAHWVTWPCGYLI